MKFACPCGEVIRDQTDYAPRDLLTGDRSATFSGDRWVDSRERPPWPGAET